MLRRIATLLAVNVVVFCVAAELIALAVFYYQTGWLYYIDPYRPVSPPVGDVQEGRLTLAALHPYFGPTHQPGVPFDLPDALRGPADSQPSAAGPPPAAPRVATNNFGFTSPVDYPFVKTGERQFVIGLFGGSVGAWFCQIGTERLLARLGQDAYFRGRELVPICVSHEGYKQPQQLLLLGYFLSIGQRFDLVINIDGFNEVALSRLNDERGSDISMPSVMHMDPLTNLIDQSSLTPEKVASLARIGEDRRRLNALAARRNGTRFASVYLVLGRLRASVDRRYQAELVRFQQLPSAAGGASLVRMTPRVRERPGAALYEDIARNWTRSSVLMHEMLAAEGVPYVHVLQPNQYFTTRAFSESEAAVALLAESPFKPGAEQGYPYLERAIRSGEFTSAGVSAFDGVHIFDAERAPVYMDNCCHYTRLGNEILADFIAASVLRTPGPWTRR